MSKQDSLQILAIRARYQKSFAEKLQQLKVLEANYQKSQKQDALDELKEYLHKLAGSSGMYGYDDLSHACRAAMAAIDEGMLQTLDQQLVLAQELLSKHA